MGVDGPVRFPRSHAADDVADGDAARSLFLCLPQRGQRVGGLPRLRQHDRQRVFRDDRIPVTVLGAVVHVDREARQRFNQVLAHEPCVPRRAAGENHDAFDVAQHGVGDGDFLEEHLAAFNRRPAKHRLFNRDRLLEDLLEHEVLVSRFFGHHGIPRDASALLRDRPAGVVCELDTRACDDRHLLVAKEDDVAGVAEDRRDVGGDEEFILPKAHDNRGAVPDRDDLAGIVGGDQYEAEQTAHVQQGATDGILEPVVLHLAFDEVRDDFGVGLGDEAVPFLLELMLQREVILDDPVVDDDDPPGAVAMRMGVLFGGAPVRGPARVPDAVLPLERAGGDDLFEAGQLPRTATQLDSAVADDRHPRRIVAPVLEPAQAVNEDRDERLLTDVTDDSAHNPGPRETLRTLVSDSSRPSPLCSPACRA